MHIDLSPDEASTLRTALDRVLRVMENELAHTEAPTLQRDLHQDVERVQRLRDRLASA
jgi:hypothetical protein